MISVVMPAFNAEATIERAIESVLVQTQPELELIVVDDGSTDGSVEIAEFWARRDARVRVLSIEHAGPGAARNAGIDIATGEWLAFLDADDEYDPTAFETILKRVGTRDVGLVIFSIEPVRAYIYAWPPPLLTLTNRYFVGEGDRAVAFVRKYHDAQQMLVYSQSNKFYRRSVVEAHGLRFEQERHFGEDQLFNFAYLRHAGAVLTMSDRLLRYHMGLPGTLSDTPPLEGISALLELSQAKLDLFRDYGYTEAQLESLKRRDVRRILEQSLWTLLRRDRTGGAESVREGFRELRAARLDARFFATDAAPTRRVRLLQWALRVRSERAAVSLIAALRRREDRAVLTQRRGEIDRDAELQRLQLTTASAEERARYYFLADYEYFLDRINHERHRTVVRDKAIALRRLAAAPKVDLLRREWLDLRRASFDEFALFAKRHGRLVVKRFDGASGNGVAVVDTSSQVGSVQQLYEVLLERKQYVVEQYLGQHEQLARFYPGAVATLRIHTLNLDGDVQIVLPTTVSFGSKGGVTSNAWSIQAFVDLDSGEITTDGIYQGSRRRVNPDEVIERHPDSDVPFRGAVIPFTAQARAWVSEAARAFPELPFIGWDVACTPDGPAIVEGNAAPMIVYSWQITTRSLLGKQGMRSDFDDVLSRFERHRKGLSHTKPRTGRAA